MIFLQYKNREYFAQFVTEDIDSYVSRKRNNHVHGNHIEIQAISEIYNRPVELYSYDSGTFFVIYGVCNFKFSRMIGVIGWIHYIYNLNVLFFFYPQKNRPTSSIPIK